MEMLSTIVSPKSRKKIFHCSTLTTLALHIPIENLLIPPSAYIQDRRLVPLIDAPYASGKRAFGLKQPFPVSTDGTWRLPRVLRETTSFILMDDNVKVEGIFRVPPLVTLLDVLREAYDRGQKYIIWKEGNATLPPPRHKGEDSHWSSQELDHEEGYGVFLAAGLIKMWYGKLRDPLFPQSTYKQLKTLYGDAKALEEAKMAELLSVESQWSILPLTSRKVLINHLLPLFAAVSQQREHNKMTPSNLAACIAPSLVCGPDALEDAKMSSIVARVITAAVEQWERGLSEACKIEKDGFLRSLEVPTRAEDYEDPLENSRERATSQLGDSQYDRLDSQFVGVVLQDNDFSKVETDRPPLPPRPRPSQSLDVPQAMPTVKRKPAPPPPVAPPRYSVIMGENANSQVEASPTSYASISDGFRHPAKRSSEGAVKDEKSQISQSGPSNANGKSFSSVPMPLTSKEVDNGPHNTRALNGGRDGPPQYQAEDASRSDRIGRKPVPSPPPSRETSGGQAMVALPGLSNANTAQRRSQAEPVRPASQGREEVTEPREEREDSPGAQFARPTWPASARPASSGNSSDAPPVSRSSKPPTLLNLAKPIQPIPAAAPPRQTSLPSPSWPKTRTPSPSLSQRFAPFQPPQRSLSDYGPRRLDLGDARVGDLKRLYEQRAQVANTLVAALRDPRT